MKSFNIFSGWRKASHCKKLIKQLRINLMKNRKDVMIRDYREDIFQHLRNGQEERAFAFAGKISKDQNILDAYELLDHFCESIMINLPYIRQNRDCPSDINEAASSLIYASARCGGDLPELPKLSKLFGDRYGNRLNLVNSRLTQKLSDIAPENCLEMDPPLQTDIRCGHNRRESQTSFLFDNAKETSPEELRLEEEMGDSFQSPQRDSTSSSSSCSSHMHPNLPQYEDFVAKFAAIKRQQSGRSSSSSSSSCSSSHIHPKLPEYDDLAAKFGAIKRQHSGSMQGN
ncbi:hypothetical protein MKX03_002130 [Papaver bracteatum]|nr:hypothetical protein MKX03_002130 [Papaver bracteatum]